jgi:acyl-coenzyme A thioesterase PaaI-like protein
MTQIKSSDYRGPVLKWWQRLSAWPGGGWLFSLALGLIAPYSGSIGVRIEEIKPGYARLTMRDRRRVRNHLKSIHAIALVNLGEIATGLALLSNFSADMRGILVGIEAEYIKKARGKLTAVAEFQMPLKLEDNTPCELEACLRDQSGETVTRVRATWLVGYKSS